MQHLRANGGQCDVVITSARPRRTVVPRAIKHPFNMPIQRAHDADPRKHRWPAVVRNESS
jgi:hypothetical protein